MATYAKSKARRRRKGESEAAFAKRITRLDRVKQRRQGKKDHDADLQIDEASACAELVLTKQHAIQSDVSVLDARELPSPQEKGAQWRRAQAAHLERVAEIEESLRALDGVSPRDPAPRVVVPSASAEVVVPAAGKNGVVKKEGGDGVPSPLLIPPNDPPPTGSNSPIIKEKEEEKKTPSEKASEMRDHLVPNDPPFGAEMIPQMIPADPRDERGPPEGDSVLSRFDFAAMSLLSGWLSQARVSVLCPHPLSLTFGAFEKEALRSAVLSIAGPTYDLGERAQPADSALREFVGRLSVGLREMGGRVWSVPRLLQACERATAVLRVPGAADPELVRRRFERQVVGELRTGTFAILGNGR